MLSSLPPPERRFWYASPIGEATSGYRKGESPYLVYGTRAFAQAVALYRMAASTHISKRLPT